MEKKGQGALEYLLLIGGAVLIAVIVIAVITGLANTSGNTVNTSATCAIKTCDQCKNYTGCAGFGVSGARTFTGATVVPIVPCTAAEATAFNVCKGA